MTDLTPLITELERIVADPDARPATKVAAIKELTHLRQRMPEQRAPAGTMQALVERYCPPIDGLEDAPPDPMRDLDAACLGADVDPLAWTWLPSCPGSSKAEVERAARDVVSSARRLGLERGPYELPGSDDELAERRRRKGAA
jgi:hypothetical protein